MAVLPDFAAANFGRRAPIDNPYFPHLPNDLKSYSEVATDPDTGEVTTARTDVLTTGAHVSVGGVQATVVRDTEYEGGLLLEDTLDFFAQDTEGNVWYFGEQVVNFEYDDDGTFLGSNTEGSFRADEPGNAPGWVVQATPVLGPAYFIEFVPGVAEDERLVAGLGETLRIGIGRFRDVVRIIESSALEPEEGIEIQFYAPGLGLIAERSLLPDGTVESEAELDLVADVARRDTDDSDDTTVALSALREGRAVRAPAEVADLDPAHFAGGGVRHVTIVRADAGSANALGAYVADARTGAIGGVRILVPDLSEAEAGDAVAIRVPQGKVLGLFLVADADRLGLDLTDYAGDGLRMINPLTGARANLDDVLAPHVVDAAGRILPMQPLSALGADDGTNYLNPAAGLHALGLASSALRGTNTRLVGFEAGAATATDRDGDFNDAVVAVGRAPLGAGVLRLLGKEAAGARLGTAEANRLIGTAGADHIDGRGGDDLIDGRGGNDFIEGGRGNDRIEGGRGGDLLRGGSGDDDFRFVRSGFGADSIDDFDRGSGDRIVLGGVTDGFAALDSTGDGLLTAADAAIGRSDGALTLDLGGGDRIAVADVGALAPDDLIFV